MGCLTLGVSMAARMRWKLGSAQQTPEQPRATYRIGHTTHPGHLMTRTFEVHKVMLPAVLEEPEIHLPQNSDEREMRKSSRATRISINEKLNICSCKNGG